MARLLRLGLALGVASFLVGVASLAPASPAVSSCAAAGPNHAAVVIQHGDGSVVTRCVAFDGGTVTGESLLNQTGIAWSGQVFGGFGNAVCAIDSEPARYSSCPGADYYWAVFVSRGGGAWQLSALGISSLTLADGDAEGFRYEPAGGTVLAPATPAGVCAAAAATPAPTRTRAPTAATGTAATTATGAAGATSAATPRSTAGAADGSSPIAAVPSGSAEINGATSGATPAATTPDPAAAAVASIPAKGPGQGPDPALILTAIAGGGLGGLLVLRLLTARRRTR